jgi:hypothetical protein
MPKYYKQLSTCNICKKRFVVENGKYYSATSYCDDCRKKSLKKD